MAYVLTINGVTKSLQPGWSINEQQNGLNRMDFVLFSASGGFRAVLDDVIVFTEAGVTIFGGVVDNPGEAGFGGASSTSAIVQKVSTVDFNVYPSRITVGTDTARPSESVKARLTWIAGLMSAQGVTLAAGQVTGPTLPAATYLANRYLVDVLAETVSLAAGTGSTSWAWEVDYTKALSAVETTGTNPTPFDVVDGDGHVNGDLTVEQPRPSTYGNYAVVLGGSGTKDRTDTFTGNGSTTTFALNYTFASSYGYVTVNGVTETIGTLGTATWSYDSSTNSIVRTSAPGVGAAIAITYVAQFPLRVFSDGGLPASARVIRTYEEPDVFDRPVLQALADSYLTRDIAAPKTVKYNTAYSLTGIHPGQVQTITSAKRNLSGSHTITAVKIVNIRGVLVQRQVTAVTTTRLPANLRQQFQQTFGTSGSAAAATSVTVVTGGTYLSTPASLGGADVQWRLCNTPTRVPNALFYDAPAALAVTAKGLVSARAAQNVKVHLWDETASSSAANSGNVACTQSPTPFSFSGTLTSGHRYWLYVEAQTSGIEATACGQLTSP